MDDGTAAGLADRRLMGTTPRGTSNERQAAEYVRGMFGGIARQYDLLNHLLSFNLDKSWRRRTVERVAALVAAPEASILDLCCGTGDVLMELERRRARPALGADFCHPMLITAAQKLERGRMGSALFEADGLALPLADASLDAVTIAFGFRNFANYNKGLAEMLRVLKPGGVAAILEFSQPKNALFARLYDWFSLVLLPRIGGLISGSRQAYSYLPESIRKFPSAELLASRMREAGFSKVEFELMTLGAVALHLGWK
jgi:demethylmenaquinone methyltransferase/2-methoxy-6-polyprenyl-1,4-benzoquinol methylase